MPKFRVTLSDGRVVTLEADQQPTEADVLMAIGQQSAPKTTLGSHPEARISAGRHSDDFGGLPPSPDLENRADANMLDIGGIGIAPETALMVGQAGRALIRPGLSLAARGGELVSQAAPIVKYYAVKKALTAMGIPADVAELAAVGVSSYRKGGAKTPTTEPTTAPTVPAAEVAPAVPTAATATRGAFNPNSAIQSARDAFTAIGEKPLPAEASNAMELIRRGKAPEEAVAIVLKNRPRTVDPAAAFNARFGTLTDDEVRAALDLRNAQGEIKTPSAETARSRR